MKRAIEIKGAVNGLIIKMSDEASMEEILAQLSLQLNGNAFYKEASFVGTVGRALSYREKAMIDDIILKETGKFSTSLEEFDDKQGQAQFEKKLRESLQAEFDKKLAMEYLPKISELEKKALVLERDLLLEKDKKQLVGGNATLHYGTLRSGSSIVFPGHVIVIGDINPGSEVIAEGNIIVIGKALGLVHAGSSGDDKAFIISSHLAPTQIRIANFVSGPAGGSKYKPKGVPEIAKLIDEKIKIEEV